MSYSFLIVDDEMFIRKILFEILEREGFEVFQAENGEEALEFLENRDVDFILLDIKMPGIDGMEVLARLSHRLVNTVVIMISGHGNYQHAVEAVKRGAFDFIEKPFSIPALLSAIEKGKKRKTVLDAYSKFIDLKGCGYYTGTEIETKINIASADLGSVLIYGEKGSGKDHIARIVLRLSGKAIFHEVENEKKLKELLQDENSVEALYIPDLGTIRPATIKKLFGIEKKLVVCNSGDPGKSVDFFKHVIALPSLAEMPNREELFYHLLEKYGRDQDQPLKFVADEAITVFNTYNWPGNFSELQDVCRLLTGYGEKGIIAASDLKHILYKEEAINLNDYLSEIKTSFILKMIENHDWNLPEASSSLGMELQDLKSFLDEHYARIRDMSGTYTLELSSDFKEIHKAQEYMSDLMRRKGMSDQKICELKLLIDELLANAIEHGYEGTEGKVWFSIITRENRVKFVVTDEGKGFYFQKTELPEDVFSLGGRGLFMAEHIGDEFHLDTSPGEGTEIITGKLIESFKVIAVGKLLKRAFFQNIQDIPIVYHDTLEDIPEDYLNSGVAVVDEEFVLDSPDKIKQIREKLPKYSIVVCGEKSTISQSGEYAFFGAEDYWPLDLVPAKIEVFVQKMDQKDEEVNRFSEMSEFYSVNQTMLENRNMLMRHDKFGKIFVLRGEKGTGKEKLFDYLAFRFPEFTVRKIDFKKEPNLISKGLETDGNLLLVRNFCTHHTRVQKNLIQELRNNCENIIVFVYEPQYSGPELLINEEVPHCVMELPPLRERKEDILHLSCIFMERACRKKGVRQKTFSMDAMVMLQNYDWPGNVDELESVINSCVEQFDDREIDREKLKQVIDMPKNEENLTLEDVLQRAEHNFLVKMHDRHGEKAYSFLGLSQKEFKKKLKEHGIN